VDCHVIIILDLPAHLDGRNRKLVSTKLDLMLGSCHTLAVRIPCILLMKDLHVLLVGIVEV